MELKNPSPRLLEIFKIDKIESFAIVNFYFTDSEDVDAAKSYLDSKLLQIERVEKISCK